MRKHLSMYSCFLALLCCGALLLNACGEAPAQGTAQPGATRGVTPTPTHGITPTPTRGLRPDLERGMIYPGWQPGSYGSVDTTWRKGVQDIKKQTGATWLEIPVLLTQDTPSSTNVYAGASTPGVDAFASGVRYAVSLGYHVFFIPLSGVNTSGGWAGIIQFGSQQQEQQWFDSYWKILKPYAQAAQDNGAEQMAIGTELSWLQENAPASMWNQLISRVRSVFKGKLTYDMNWTPSLYDPPQSWMSNPELSAIGLSEYVPLVDSAVRVDPAAMPDLWKARVGKLIDAFSNKVHKPIILSEVGYRNTSDALYAPYSAQSDAPVDQQEQAGAYAATLINVFGDSAIIGVFFWAWDNVARESIAGMQAVQVVNRWYTRKA